LEKSEGDKARVMEFLDETLGPMGPKEKSAIILLADILFFATTINMKFSWPLFNGV
jgi:hypothetical protein